MWIITSVTGCPWTESEQNSDVRGPSPVQHWQGGRHHAYLCRLPGHGGNWAFSGAVRLGPEGNDTTSSSRPGSQAHPTAPGRSRVAGVTGAAPAAGIKHLPGDRNGDRPRLGWDMGPCQGLAQWSPWPGRAGLWGAPDGPCCSVTGAGAGGSGGWHGVVGHGQVGGAPGSQAASGRTTGALQALTQTLTCCTTPLGDKINDMCFKRQCRCEYQ